MGQLVAKARKVPCQGSSTYMRSPLAYPKNDNVVGPDAVLV